MRIGYWSRCYTNQSHITKFCFLRSYSLAGIRNEDQIFRHSVAVERKNIFWLKNTCTNTHGSNFTLWMLKQGQTFTCSITISYHLTFSVFSPIVKTWTFVEPLSIITESSLLLICMPLESTLKMFPGVSERAYSVATFSRMLTYDPTCSCSFFVL